VEKFFPFGLPLNPLKGTYLKTEFCKTPFRGQGAKNGRNQEGYNLPDNSGNIYEIRIIK
jgi:hypothetical protein